MYLYQLSDIQIGI
nr:unnamed protein product [Callosobruchus chinensis]